jgi:hypothetical protein
MSPARDVDAITRELSNGETQRPFDPAEIDGLPEPVRRYFAASIASGATVATAVRLRMRGHMRIGRWVSFGADEVLAPHRGFVWRAHAARLIAGHDAYFDGWGAMQWRLLGLVTVMRADGGDITRSAAGRCGGEAVWVPSALLPRFGVKWTVASDREITARFAVDTTSIDLHLELEDNGRPRSLLFDRWGDPDRTGTFGWHQFGGTITEHRTFQGITIPSSGRWGWHYGTERWRDGEFFRCRITQASLLGG